MPQGGVVMLQINDLEAGTNKLSFFYTDPSGLRLPSSTTTFMGIWKTPTNVALTSSTPVSDVGGRVEFTATVGEPRVGLPVTTGVVEFYIGDRLVATSLVDELGQAKLSTSALVPGGYTITAVYRESRNHQASQSAGIAHRVEPLPVAAKPVTV
ncbi:hypothetical protein HK102_011527, partial [Quaeritorhiza haematococci]